MRRETSTVPSDRGVTERGRDQPQSVEEQGKRVWKEIEGDFGRSVRRAGYVGVIVLNAILLAVAHSLPGWHVGFITSAFVQVLWAVDLSLGAAIVVNAMFLVDDSPPIRVAGQVVQNVFALVSGYTLYRIFPFDFGTTYWNGLARTGLVVVLALLILGTIVETIRFLVDDHGRIASR